MKNSKVSILLFFSLISLVMSSCNNSVGSSQSNESNMNISHSSNDLEEISSITQSDINSETDENVITSISISNKSSLMNKWSCQNGLRFVEISTNSKINISSALEEGLIEIISSDINVVTVLGQYLCPVSVGNATITVISGNVSDVVEVSVSEPSNNAPRLILNYDGVAKFKTIINEPISLPKYVCFDSDNNDISSSVIIKSDIDPNAVFDFATGNFTTSVKGEHTISYEVVNPKNPDDVIKESVKVNVYQKILHNYGSYKDILENEKSDNPTFRSTDNGFSVNTFYLEPSTTYYAEAIFDGVDTITRGSSWGIGMLHSTNENINKAIFLKDYLSVNSNGTWSHKYGPFWNEGAKISDSTYSYKKQTISLNLTNKNETIKYAVARNGDYFYTFINDKLAETHLYSSYKNVGTIPGIILVGDHSSKCYPGKASNIDFYSGNKAIDKINELTSTSSTFDYARLVDKDNYDHAEFKNNSFSFKSSAVTGTDDWWHDAVKANYLFAGNTKIEFDYQFNSSLNSSIASDTYSESLIYVSSALDTTDPTKSANMSSGLKLCYWSGDDNLDLAELFSTGTNSNKVTVLNHTGPSSSDNMNYNIKKYRITIEIISSEPADSNNGSCPKFIWTLTELEGTNPQSITLEQTSNLANPSWESPSNSKHQQYYLCFASGHVSYEISNLSITSTEIK